MGHSMGATITPLVLAFEPRFRAAVLSGAGASWIANLLYKQEPLALAPAIELLLEYTGQGRKIAPGAYIRAILGTPQDLVASAPPDEQARLQTVLDEILPVSRRRKGLLNDARVVSSLPRYDLEKIAAPTLAISTADDGYGTFAGARYTAEHVPGARFIGYPNGGHMLVGRSAAASAEILAFLRAIKD